MSHSPPITDIDANSDINDKRYQEEQNEAIAYQEEHNDIADITDIVDMPRVGSMSSLSSACSFNTFGTNQRNDSNEEEIFENVQSLSVHEAPLLTTGLSPSPKRVSPISSPNNNQNTNNMHEQEPILSALNKLYTHNLAHNNNNNNNNHNLQHPQHIHLSHQDLKDMTHSVSDQTDVDLHDDPSTKPDKNNIDCNRSDKSASCSSINSITGALLNGIRTVNNYIASDEQNNEEDEEKKEDCDLNESAQSLHDILSSPHFMESAIQMYGNLDNALTNINNLKSHQLQQMKSLRRRKQRKRSHIYTNLNNDADDDEDDDQTNDKIQEIDVNERVVFTMKTLITSTTQMGSLFSISNSSQSVFGVLFEKLSSSIAYMSYISVSAITPFIYNMVECVLLELYATIKDIIEYYDPDPKNNVLWRIIDKMNEIIEAIQGLLALSDCFYEICSESEEDEDEDEDDDDDVYRAEFEKEKQD